MTEPPRLRALPPSPSPSSPSDLPVDPAHTLLYAEADRFATDWMTPLRNQAMDIQGHALELCHMAGWVGRYVADAQMTAGERPLRKAREDLHRVVGLCAVLHDLLTELEHDAPPVNA